MKNKSSKNSNRPQREIPKESESGSRPSGIYPNQESERKRPDENPEERPWWTQGTPGCVFMDEITVYYSLN